MLSEIKFVFRGTTIGYEGGKHSQTLPVTCTTEHPAKALWFAMQCAAENPEIAVVYIAKMEKLAHLSILANVLKKKEEEVAFEIAPKEFYSLTEGYVHYKDLQKLLSGMGFDVYQLVRIDNLTELCSRTATISDKDLEKLVEDLEKFIKRA